MLYYFDQSDPNTLTSVEEVSPSSNAFLKSKLTKIDFRFGLSNYPKRTGT